jgi:hypothetical protein
MNLRQLVFSPWNRFLKFTGLDIVYQILAQLIEEAAMLEGRQ